MPTGYPDYEQPIDVAAQTLTSQDINIKTQEADVLMQRPRYGAIKKSGLIDVGVGANDQTTKTVTTNGPGLFFYGYMQVEASTGSHNIFFTPVLDGEDITAEPQLSQLSDWGIDQNVPYQQLTKYSADGECFVQFAPPTPLPFENTLEAFAADVSGNAQTAWAEYVYTEL